MSEDRRSVRFAIYTRKSADTTADFSSCDAQFAVCCDFAKATGDPNLAGEVAASLAAPACCRRSTNGSES
jgi:hypothetical protein